MKRIHITEAVTQRCTLKRTFFLKKLSSCEYCEIFKNTFFEEHLRTPASACCGYNTGIVLVVSNDFNENKRSEKSGKVPDKI